MQVAVLQSGLKDGLAKVMRAVASKSTLPILSNVLLATDNGRLRLQATNLDIGVTCYVGAKVEGEGSTTLNGKLLHDWIGNLSDTAIKMRLDPAKQIMNLVAGGAASNMHGIEADEFPSIPRFETQPFVTLECATFRDAIKQVAYAAASDDSMRPVITGVLMRFSDHRLTLAAIDGFRLAVKRMDFTSSVGGEAVLIIPARTLTHLASILADEGDVAIALTQNGTQVLFKTDSFELVSRLIDGKFPDYERMIPKTHTARTIVDRADLARSIRTAQVFAASSANSIHLKMIAADEASITQAKLIVNGTAAEVGDNTTEFPADIEMSDPSAEIKVNSKYLSDVCSSFGTGQMVLEMTTAGAPLVVRPAGDESLLCLVMPMTPTK